LVIGRKYTPLQRTAVCNSKMGFPFFSFMQLAKFKGKMFGSSALLVTKENPKRC
jgi:hypothetical protein